MVSKDGILSNVKAPGSSGGRWFALRKYEVLLK